MDVAYDRNDHSHRLLQLLQLIDVITEEYIQPDDETVHDHMDKNRDEEAAGHHIQETERVTHGQVNQDMGEVEMGDCEYQPADEPRNQEGKHFISRIMHGEKCVDLTEYRTPEYIFLYDRPEYCDDQDHQGHGFDHADDFIRILAFKRIAEDIDVDHAGDHLGSIGKDHTADDPDDGHGDIRLFALFNGIFIMVHAADDDDQYRPDQKCRELVRDDGSDKFVGGQFRTGQPHDDADGEDGELHTDEYD